MASKTPKSDPPSVLLVEDDREASTIYAEYLESKGFRVLTTRSPAEALRIARKEQPALILMDLQLPQMSGAHAVRELKSSPETATIPIVVMTASSLDMDRHEARASGCDAFVEKPCRPPELLRQIDGLLRGRVTGTEAEPEAPPAPRAAGSGTRPSG